jgi:ABC-2 type transport system ATP-binding protein
MISVARAEQRLETEAHEAGSALVSVSHLTKSYGTRPAVRDVSFEARAGVTGILGPNGAGKSTMLRCLAGLSGWDVGEIRLAGVDPARRTAEARRKIGFMPERVAFPSEMRVARYLRYVAEMKGVPARQRRDAVDVALHRARLHEERDRVVGNLSKGYRQRVGLAQALLGEPAVLILDEPSAGLDPLNVMEFRDVIRASACDRAVLVSTHMLTEARMLCDRVVVMSAGRVVYDGATTDFAVDGTTEAVEEAFRRAVQP